MPGKDGKNLDDTKKGSSKSTAGSDKSQKDSLSSSDSGHTGNVIVVARFRPLNQNELNHGGMNV